MAHSLNDDKNESIYRFTYEFHGDVPVVSNRSPRCFEGTTLPPQIPNDQPWSPEWPRPPRFQVQPAAEDFVFRQLEAGHVAVRRFAAHLVAFRGHQEISSGERLKKLT